MGLWFGIVVCVNLSLVLALLPCIVLGRPAGFDNKADSESCDYINGEWVYDASLPLYNSSSCPFITTAFDCQKNGRPDKDYLKYQWKPSNCVLPKFNGEDFLERNRGKKIMFVGDSISDNMMVSLACLLHSAVPTSTYTTDATSIHFQDYGVSILYTQSGFLVDLVDQQGSKVLKLDSISTGNKWQGVDMLIFNTYHWWFHTGHLQKWNYFEVEGKLQKDMDRLKALGTAWTTWANWVDTNVDPSKTKVFYQGVATTHQDAREWKDPTATDCRGQTEPIKGSKYPGMSIQGEAVIKSIISKMTKPVYFLDITLLTQLRKDGHPSVYAGGGDDCSHWCVPGAPDAWNQILYAASLGK
ncbi:protein trichome birefringence-like 42 [Tripterygium wilfordii]|uniref:protein trichome birefringence-like 42 n=1 Tax=Tripterygium wilfordii TaxID=458696 RepID=UPI0018F84B1E|nr:protein trichome birefringence-like 42 [Tripterygium wilfordii]